MGGNQVPRTLETLCSELATTLERQHGIRDAVISLAWLDHREWQAFVEGHESKFGIYKANTSKAAVVRLFNAVIAARS